MQFLCALDQNTILPVRLFGHEEAHQRITSALVFELEDGLTEGRICERNGSSNAGKDGPPARKGSSMRRETGKKWGGGACVLVKKESGAGIGTDQTGLPTIRHHVSKDVS